MPQALSPASLLAIKVRAAAARGRVRSRGHPDGGGAPRAQGLKRALDPTNTMGAGNLIDADGAPAAH